MLENKNIIHISGSSILYRVTMPTCSVPGCTSGYKTNPEKRHFFTIPKDATSLELWKRAIKRENVKSGYAVCQNHFRVKEILWQRLLLGADGSVLGVVSYDYHQILNFNVLLSLFLRCYRNFAYLLLMQNPRKSSLKNGLKKRVYTVFPLLCGKSTSIFFIIVNTLTNSIELFCKVEYNLTPSH